MREKVNQLPSKLKRNRSLLLIFGLGIFAFLLLLLLNHRIPGSDDTVFQTQILPFPDVFSWVVDRYHTWSGRLFSEGFVYLFSPAPFYVWQIVTLVVFALFSGMLFAYSQLFTKRQSASRRTLTLILALSMLFLMNHHVLAEGGLWMTGSMVYFWMSTLGLIAFYPIAYYIARQHKPHWLITCSGIISAIIAASSQEQVGAVLLGLTVAALVYQLKIRGLQHEKVPWYMIIFGCIIGISLFVSLLAPGNAARMEAETLTWLPDFRTTPFLERLEYGYRWLLEAFINHAGFLLVTAWAAMAALFAAQVQKNKLDYTFIFIFSLAAILTLASGSELLSQLFNFYATWKPDVSSSFISLNLLPWGIILLCTVIAPLFLFPKKPLGYALSLLYAASIASAAILLLSPTMYASLWRSFFVPSVLLLIAALFLLEKVLSKYPKYRFVIVALIVSIALLHYLFQAARLAQPV